MEIFSEYKHILIITHIIAVIIGMATALIADVFFTIFSRDKTLTTREQKILRSCSPIVWVSLTIIILTGIGIFLSNPSTYITSAKFLAKMSIVGILTLNGLIINLATRRILRDPKFLTAQKFKKDRVLAFICGAISLVSWLYALALALYKDTIYSYTEIMRFYTIILITTILLSLIIEKRKFD